MNSTMNDRWNTCLKAARAATDEAAPPVPYGFAQRVLRNLAPTASDRLDVWMLIGRRALALATVLLLAAGAFAWWDYPAMAFEAPQVTDNVMDQALWQP